MLSSNATILWLWSPLLLQMNFYFRTAAAVWGATKQPEDVLSHHSNGVVQTVADNYDCDIHLMSQGNLLPGTNGFTTRSY